MSDCGSKGCGCAATNVVTPADGDAAAVDLKRSRYRIDNMDCPTEETLIRNKLAALPGVVNLEFNLMQRSLAVQHRLPSPAPIEQALA
ncbi:cation transporter, partial [Rhizobium ruizarguesonis]|nr:cation-transporting P-type ATPase [Rhizobium ruizarguesonis]